MRSVSVTRNLPLADQVRNRLLEWIQSDQPELADGVLPSEAELAEQFDTSRATIREALAQLERDRIVIRRQGAGTFINPALRKLTSTVNELVDPLTLIEQAGYRATLGGFERQESLAGEEAAGLLGIPPDSATVVIQALYLADDTPALHLQASIPIDDIPSGEAPSGIPALPFYALGAYAAEVSGRSATHSIATIKAEAAGEALALRLGVPAGSPLLTLQEIYLTDQGRPAFLCRMSLISERIALQLLRNSYRPAQNVAIW
jgi:GntR family transcriptional regulator